MDKNIADDLRSGKILDIGCGNFPYFLSRIKFVKKIGVDKEFGDYKVDDIELIKFNFESGNLLPFEDKMFEVITILAVLEHMKSELACDVLKEARRVLKNNGELFITVPRDRGDKLLRLLSMFGFVSKVEIDEHVQLYNKSNLTNQLLSAGFKKGDIEIRSFEFGFNIFVKVRGNV